MVKEPMRQAIGASLQALAVAAPVASTALEVSLASATPGEDEEFLMLTGLVLLVVSLPLFVVGMAVRQSSPGREAAETKIHEETGRDLDVVAGSVAWRWDAGTNAYYFWDGRRYTTAARWTGSKWAYGKIKSVAQKRARLAFWWSFGPAVGWVFLYEFVPSMYWIMPIPIAVASYLVVDTFRQAKRSREIESPAVWTALLILLLQLLAFGCSMAGVSVYAD